MQSKIKVLVVSEQTHSEALRSSIHSSQAVSADVLATLHALQLELHCVHTAPAYIASV